jgi:hypothetical protein
VKEKTSMPTLTPSDDNMDLLDDDESPLIKDGSPPPTSMDINMVFTLPTEFRGVKEEIAQLCLGPKEVVFEKSEQSSQYLKPLYVQGHIDRRSISRMLVDNGATVNLMSYSMFNKVGREDDELVKTNLPLNGMRATRWRLEASSPWSSPWGASRLLPRSSSLRCKVTIVSFWVVIGFTLIIMFPLLCTSFLFNGLMRRSRWYTQTH